MGVRELISLGERKVFWAQRRMPVLTRLRRERRGSLKGVKISACLHVTSETANLVLALKEAGAQVRLCASNPLSTQDDVAEFLRTQGIEVFAKRGESEEQYWENIRACAEWGPDITLDDGADLTAYINQNPQLAKKVKGGTEETTTGVIRLRAMEREGALRYPVVAVNESKTKFLFDNRYGTGQSTVDGVLRATNILIAGRKAAVAGYGWCGRGIAARLRAMGARVIVVEVDPVKALEALMDGYEVCTVAEAVKESDLFITATGNKGVVRPEHLEIAKDGIILANAGHFDVEIDVAGLREMAVETREIRPNLEEFILPNGKRVYLLAQGRLVNLGAAEGHPSEVMDLSFSNQFLAVYHILEGNLRPGVHVLPEEIDREIARLKLEAMGGRLERLTEEQVKYLESWREGT